MKQTVFCNFYISIIVDIYLFPPSYSADKDNSNNSELEELGVIALDAIYVYLTASEISSNPPKIGHVLTQWALVPLGPTLIYNSNKKTVFCCFHI